MKHIIILIVVMLAASVGAVSRLPDPARAFNTLDDVNPFFCFIPGPGFDAITWMPYEAKRLINETPPPYARWQVDGVIYLRLDLPLLGQIRTRDELNDYAYTMLYQVYKEMPLERDAAASGITLVRAYVEGPCSPYERDAEERIISGKKIYLLRCEMRYKYYWPESK